MNLQDAFHQTVHSAPGGCEALAVRLGMSAAVLRNKANPNSNFNKPTLDDIERITALTGDLRVLDAWAASHDRVLVKVAESEGHGDVALLELVTAVMSSNGEVGREVLASLEDGRITLAEVERVAKAVKVAERALEGVVARLRSMVHAPGGVR
jgi:hypothetical protein